MSRLILSLDGQVLKEIKLDKERLSIGRRPHNDLQIDNLAVSGQHALITTLGHDSFLEDLDSTNGTQVNGNPIKKHHLLDGDLIEIGKYRIKYSREMADGPEQKQFDATVVIRPEMSAAAPVTSIGDTVSMLEKKPRAADIPAAVLRVIGGPNAGKELPLNKDSTTFGRPGVLVVAVLKRPQGYFLQHVEGERRAEVNGEVVGDPLYPLVHKDRISVAGIELEMVFRN